MDSFKIRLLEALKLAKMNNSQLAKSVSVTAGTVGHWLHRDSLPSATVLPKVAAALGVTTDWLVYGTGPMKASNIIPIEDTADVTEGFVQIPEYAVHFGAGDCPEPSYDEIEDAVPATFRLSFFTSRGIDPKHCRRFHVVGDSMAPIIMPGDSITVDCSIKESIESNQIYALIYEHSLRVKRLIKTFKSLIIRSENPAYKDEELTLEEAGELIIIVGKVIERSGSL